MLNRHTASSPGLWRHPGFMKLWAGQTVSQFGSMVTRDALPLIGVLVLRASPMLGRVSASVHFFEGGVTTCGLVAGGALAQVIGIRPAVWVAALGGGLAVLWLLASPVRTLRET